MFEEIVVEIFSSEMGVSSDGFDCEYAVGDGEEGDIESPTSEIKDQNVLLFGGFRVETVGDGCGGGLVDDSEDV